MPQPLAPLVSGGKPGDQAAPRPCPGGLRPPLHSRPRPAGAGRPGPALALRLDHADAAVAVRPIAGLGRVAQVRKLDAEAARGAENGLAVADVDLALINAEGRAFGLSVRAHYVIPMSLTAWSARPGNISARTAA